MLAVLGVSDKRSIEVLAGGLLDLGWDVVATEGTRRAIAEAGLSVGAVSDLAGVPTMLGGRVKTLTVSVMAGILARDAEPDLSELAEHGVERVHLVACNYYVLPAAASSMDQFREKIDVGGPAMLRAAGKNCAHVVPLCDPDDYAGVVAELAAAGGSPEGVSQERRFALAAKAFEVSAAYEASVAALFRSSTG
ncbi:phosphoribosylaminoimidazolecarboxamide formyltransferase [Actinokineospora bangkokensis]|uniref:Phosphoribosylaminoimidazolecarboxamide formyltransferase n=1 Tax=Actinokineospora bangkokensis TaxID=1193682 RepID=A0A1Q9LJR3_9PSEU|nr:phosphoribosylaminoimidazolecarboxamide formyltransferase [Actinokineospora bangkokensis]OLR92235.1 phosphoribosylaminoimidazolecarboxamide formyltransferase [Actinokineospora bangkokensis]